MLAALINMRNHVDTAGNGLPAHVLEPACPTTFTVPVGDLLSDKGVTTTKHDEFVDKLLLCKSAVRVAAARPAKSGVVPFVQWFARNLVVSS